MNGNGAQDILAGRLTIDTGTFNKQVSDAVKAANDAISSIGKRSTGNSNTDAVQQRIARITSFVKQLSIEYQNLAKAEKVGDSSAAQAFNGRISQLTAYIERLKNQAELQHNTNKISEEGWQKVYNAYQKARLITEEYTQKSVIAWNKQKQEIEKAVAAINKANEAANKKEQKAQVDNAAAAYRNLTTAISEYNKAKARGDKESQDYWNEQIKASEITVNKIKENIDALGLDESARQKILNIIQKCTGAIADFNNEQNKGTAIVNNLASTWDKMWRGIKMISGFSMAKIFKDAVSYAEEFDAALTDIEIITGRSHANVLQLGERYRQLASDLQVTSTSIAKTAATVFRQGYTDPKQVEAIISGATKFGAVTGQTTESALQSMTATMQNFYREGMDIVEFVEHIGDVWSYMGDNVATTGEDISIAMDKMAASVQMVGVSFEEASSWAAIMLARTQQSGEVIGTQINSLVARYSKITSKGYAAVTSDDQGEALSFNDVSKALQKAGIEIYDVATKTFLPMNEMMDQLAKKWNTLDDATKRYIATTLGGTRGMNYLITLLDNYDDALELQAAAMDGTMDRKYDVWLESVEAAQNNLNNSMENLYKNLQANVLKDFYNGMAGVVDVVSRATNGTNGLNIKILALTVGVIGVASAIGKVINTIKALSLASSVVKMTSGIGAVIGALGLLVSVIGLVRSSIEQAKTERLAELSETISKNSSIIGSRQSISDELEELANKTSLNSDEMDRFIELRKEIVKDSPYLQAQYGKEGEKISDATEALRINNEEIEKNLKLQQALYRDRYRLSKGDIFESISSARYGPSHSIAYRQSSVFGYNAKDIWGNDLKGTQGTNYIDYAWELLNNDDFNLTLESAKTLREGLRAAGRELQIAGTEYEDRYNEVVNDIEAFIEIKNAELIDTVQENVPIIIGGLFDSDDAMKFADDSFMTKLITDLLVEYAPDEQVFDSLLAPEIKTVGNLYGRMMSEGMTEEIYNGFEEYRNASGDPLIREAVASLTDEYLKAMVYAADVTDMNQHEKFVDKVKKGLPLAVLRAINEGFLAINNDEGLSEYERNEAIYTYVGNLLEMTDAELSDFANDYTIALPLNIAIDEDSTNIDSFVDKLHEATGAVTDLSKAISRLEESNHSSLDSWSEELLLSEDDLLALAKAYPQLTDAIIRYHNAMAEDPMSFEAWDAERALLEELKDIQNMDEFFAGMDEIDNLISAIKMLEGGDYDTSDIQNLFKLFPELMELDPAEWLDYLNGKLDESSEKWSEMAEALGLTIDEAEHFDQAVSAIIHPMNDAQKAREKLMKGEQLSTKELSALLKLYPDLADEIEAYGKDTSQTDKLIKALNKDISDSAFNDWADSVESALKTLDAAEAGTREYDAAMKELAKSFDFQGFGMLDNLQFVTQNLDLIREAANGSAEAFYALQEAAWINVVGTSTADFSSVIDGLYATEAEAEAAFRMLEAMGLGTVEYQNISGGFGQVLTPDGNGGFTVTQVPLEGRVAFWKPAASNPLSGGRKSGTSSGSSGGGGSGKKGGGGGGGSSTINVSDATQKLVDSMSEQQESFDNTLKMIELKRTYHDIRGELQGVIKYTEMERDVLQEQNTALEQNIANLEAQISKQEAIVAKNKQGSKAYEQAAKDLEALNSAHKEYTEKLQENINRIEEIKKEFKELREQIRQTVISVQELIRETLEGQAELAKSMLDNTVSIEDEIFDAIKRRYEREQELAIDTAKKKQEALQDEIDKIDELIAAREKLLNKEKEEEEIAELQAKIARIAADPTRRKEMLELQDQLAEKQKQAAWETYKEELEAQKENLQEQSDNLDDYIDEVNEYYEELFENPKQLLAELRDIMKKTDDEIIAWLKDNYEEWTQYTEAKQEQTEQGWKETLDAMRGITETYQKEIEEIMSWTDEEIINWLKENNVEFQNATKEQQDSFIYGWQKTLDDWRNAYREVVAEINATQYTSIPTSGSSGGSGGGSGGSSSLGGGGGYSIGGTSGGSGTSSIGTAISSGVNSMLAGLTQSKNYKGTTEYKYLGGNGKTYTVSGIANSTVSVADALKKSRETAVNNAKTSAKTSWDKAYNSKNALQKVQFLPEYTKAKLAIASATASKDAKGYVWFARAYKKGGLVDSTGPAWLDGTKSDPERVLSPYQTKLFEDLINTLHVLKTVNVPGLRSLDGIVGAYNGGGFTIENIEINVDRLDSDTDIRALANRIGELINDELRKTSAIGGIRI